MSNWGIVFTAAMFAITLGGCAAKPEAKETPPSKPLEQMLISFNGSPTMGEITEALNDAFAATDTPITDENYSRAGSVLVKFRQEYGVDEMEILDCIPGRANDPRVKDNAFASIAAVCVTDLRRK
jgi:ABC-type phosphate transport system substrate-binding protein